jgi:hypothetical protein
MKWGDPVFIQPDTREYPLVNVDITMESHIYFFLMGKSTIIGHLNSYVSLPEGKVSFSDLDLLEQLI